MSRLLKLANIETYIGALTATGVGTECAKVTRGQVCRWNDKDAASVLTGHNIDKEGQPKPYFVDVTDTHDGAVDWDFTVKDAAAAETATAAAQAAPAAAPTSQVSSAPRRTQRQTPARAGA